MPRGLQRGHLFNVFETGRWGLRLRGQLGTRGGKFVHQRKWCTTRRHIEEVTEVLHLGGVGANCAHSLDGLLRIHKVFGVQKGRSRWIGQYYNVLFHRSLHFGSYELRMVRRKVSNCPLTKVGSSRVGENQQTGIGESLSGQRFRERRRGPLVFLRPFAHLQLVAWLLPQSSHAGQNRF